MSPSIQHHNPETEVVERNPKSSELCTLVSTGYPRRTVYPGSTVIFDEYMLIVSKDCNKHMQRSLLITSKGVYGEPRFINDMI